MWLIENSLNGKRVPEGCKAELRTLSLMDRLWRPKKEHFPEQETDLIRAELEDGPRARIWLQELFSRHGL